ncbi:hypothetical protein LMG27952_05074 [Paraburkholderia hiiakae]|uniref:Transposase IS66 family protein n=1 Tax=Paraburkholderia hiiakae TaxID=1081782 RepID=A0ABM8NZK3_9BURK|nr:hypothetical protein LMG27952_05074 [Paraburkholderia hiiakae]
MCFSGRLGWRWFRRNKAYCYAQVVKVNNVIDEAEPESGSGARAQVPALPALCNPDVCAWYVSYSLSPRNLEEMTAKRGIAVDHSTVHRWALKLLPVLEKAFRRNKRPVGKS